MSRIPLRCRPLYVTWAAALAVAGLASCTEEAASKADADAATVGETTPAAETAVASDTADSSQSDTAPPADVPEKPLTKGIWTQLAVPADPNVSLHSVWTDGTARVVAAGTNGTILQNNGLGWQVATQSKFATLNAAAGGPGGNRTFAVGLGGTIVQALGQEGAPGLAWGPPGGCSKPADCDDKDPCTADSCDSGVCGHQPSGNPACCGGTHFSDSFDKGLGNWTVADTFSGAQGGIVWTSSEIKGKDGGARATSPPKAAYFGRTDVPCDDGEGFCATFDNGKTVGSTMLSGYFSLPKAGAITLSFQAFLDVEQGYYDQVQVWVETDKGQKAMVWEKYKVLTSGTTNGKFAPQAIDLTQYQSQKIRLELRFNSLTTTNNAGEGVFIDDLVVASKCGEAAGGGKTLTTGTLFGVWAAADDDAWAVGEKGFTAHWDGIAWAIVTGGGKSRSVLGMGGAGKQGFAVGEFGLTAVIANGAFKMGAAGTEATLRAVAAVAGANGGIQEALAVGAQGTVLSWQAGVWTKQTTPMANLDLHGVAGFADGTWAVVTPAGIVWQRSASGDWKNVASAGLGLRAVVATGPSTGWAVGQFGNLMERQGATWQKQPNLDGGATANALWAESHDEVWAVGDGGVAWHRSGGQWVQEFTATSVNLQAVWGASPTSVYAAGLLASIIHYDGTGWEAMSGPPGIDWKSLWGTSDTDVWVGGTGGAVAHWDGQEWTLLVEPVNDTLRAVWGLSADNVWAVGEKGGIYHSSGAGWKKTPIEPYQPDPEQDAYEVKSTLLTVWGAAANDVWAAGEPDQKNHGVIVHWDGIVWKYLPILYDVPRTIRAMWGWNASNILLAGTQGTVLQLNGKDQQLGSLEAPTIATLFAIAPYGKGALLVGDIGTVLRYSPPPLPKP